MAATAAAAGMVEPTSAARPPAAGTGSSRVGAGPAGPPRSRSPASDDSSGTSPAIPAGATRSGLIRPNADGPPALAGDMPSPSAAPTVITSGSPATPRTDCGPGPRSPAGATTAMPACGERGGVLPELGPPLGQPGGDLLGLAR